jgi:hypothetical protein
MEMDCPMSGFKPSDTVLSVGDKSGVTMGKYDDVIRYHIELGCDSDMWDCEETINHEVLHVALFSLGYHNNQFLDALYICGEHYQPLVWFLKGFRAYGLGC